MNMDLGEERLKENEEIREELLRESNYKDGVNFFKRFDYIPIDELHEMPPHLNFFRKPSSQQLLDLITSLECMGLITPLLVMKEKDEPGYMVVLGRSRLMALTKLYKETNLEKYEKVPCLILEEDDIDYLMLQHIVIDSNMQYRTIDKATLIKAVIIQRKLLVMSKQYRGEFNVTRTLATRFQISRSTVEDYLSIDKLHPDIQNKVFKHKMTLKVAKALSKVDHEKQLFIVETLGDKIHDFEKVNSLVGYNPNKPSRVLDPKTNTLVFDTWENKVQRVLKMTPPMTSINLNIASGAASETLLAILKARKSYAMEEMRTYPKDNSNEFFRITINKNHMQQYVDAGLLDKEVLDKIKEKKFKDIQMH